MNRKRPASVPRKQLVARRTVANPGPFILPKGLMKAVHNAEMQQAEKKFWDTTNGVTFAVDYSGTAPTALTHVPQGSSDTSRVGDALTVRRLRFTQLTTYNGSASTATSINNMRLVIFAWKPFETDVAPTVAKVLTYTTLAYAASAPLTHDGREQFVLLHDSIWTHNNQSHVSKVLNLDIKLNHIVQYKAGSTTNCAGGLYCFWISDNTGTGNMPFVYNYSSRVDFVDC